MSLADTAAHKPYLGRTAIVTGGAGAIGFAIATTLMERGAKVGMIDVDDTRFKAALDVKAITPDACFFAHGSVVDDAAMQENCTALAAKLGGVDWLVTSAGRLSARSLSETSLAEWNEDLSINLNGAFLAARYTLPHMRDHGAIVFVSSVTGHNGSKISPAYAAAKGGLLALARSLTHELMPRAIRVNCVSPGVIDTDFAKAFTRTLQGKKQDGVSGTARDVAAATAFLCSDEAGFINGETIVMTGGQAFA